jgi:hypothetical protein
MAQDQFFYFNLATEAFRTRNILWKRNSVVLVRKRTISIERPPLVGEVSSNFCG